MWQWSERRCGEQPYTPVRSAAATLHQFGESYWVLLSGGFGDNSVVEDALHVCELKVDGSPLDWKMAGRSDLLKRHDHTLETCADRVLMYGGSLRGDFFEDLVEIRVWGDQSMRVQTVSCTGDSPGPRSNHTMATVGSALWLFGGCRLDTDPHEVYNDVLVCNADVWTRLDVADPPPARSGHSCVVFGGGLVVFGGWDGEDLLQDLSLCDGAAWRQLQPTGQPPSPRACHSATLVSGDQMVVHGGLATFDHLSSSCCVLDRAICVLDLSLLRWSAVQFSGALPPSRAFHCALPTVGAKSVLVLGGGTRTDDDGTNFADAYELRMVAWTPEAHSSFPPPDRQRINTWLLVGQRLQLLPVGLWLYVASFWVGSLGRPDSNLEEGGSFDQHLRDGDCREEYGSDVLSANG